MARILIIEDDLILANGIKIALGKDYPECSICHLIHTAYEALKKAPFDLVLLDLNLPDGNGLELLTYLKKHTQSAVIILTANDMEMDIVQGFEEGADDYMTKPFSLGELRARIKTRLKDRQNHTLETYANGPFLFDFESLIFKKHGQAIELSKTEIKLLQTLTLNKGMTLSREQLMSKIWTEGSQFVDENALSVAVKRLRDKIEDQPNKPKWIKTVYGLGYSWCETAQRGD